MDSQMNAGLHRNERALERKVLEAPLKRELRPDMDLGWRIKRDAQFLP
jgi:hypothetical protein